MRPLTESSLLRPLRDFLLKRNFDHTAALVKFLHQHFISQRINPNRLNSVEILAALLAAVFPDFSLILSQDTPYLYCFEVFVLRVPLHIMESSLPTRQISTHPSGTHKMGLLCLLWLLHNELFALLGFQNVSRQYLLVYILLQWFIFYFYFLL